MIYTGVRIGELCSLRWRDVDLHAGWLHVPGTNTSEADRRVKIRGALSDELQALRDRVRSITTPTCSPRARGGASTSARCAQLPLEEP